MRLCVTVKGASWVVFAAASGRVVKMTLKQIAAREKLFSFLALFADCFDRREGRDLLAVDVQGQLCDVHREKVEAIGLRFGTARVAGSVPIVTLPSNARPART